MRHALRLISTLASALPLALGAAACGDDDEAPTPATFDLMVVGSGYQPHTGQTVEMAVVSSAGAVLARDTQTIGADGALAFTFPGVLREGQTYAIHFYADMNGNGMCDAPPIDHVWSVPVPSVTGPTTITYDHDVDFTDVCASFDAAPAGFDLTLTGSGYQPHAGQLIGVAVVDAANDQVVAFEGITMGADGQLLVIFEGVLVEGESYLVRFFADLNGNGECDAPPDDHSWELEAPDVTADVTLTYNHDTDFAYVCQSFGGPMRFDLNLSGTGYQPHAGQLMEVAIVAATDRSVLAHRSLTMGADGVLNVDFLGALVPGADHLVRFYADLNGDGECDTPPADHSWEIPLEDAMGHESVVYNHDTDFTYVCDSFGGPVRYDLTLMGSGYNPHIGQLVEVAVVDASDDVVASSSTTMGGDGVLHFRFLGALTPGGDYRVRWYADHNGNGMCDDFPADHSWEVSVDDVMDHVVIDYPHDTSFSSVCDSF